MDHKTCTQIALGTIILQLLLLLYLPHLSIADVIYSPVDHFTINCGSSTPLSTPDGRNWTADMKFLSQSDHASVRARAQTPSTIQGPYTYARLSHSQFSYSFPVTPGTPKFLRLFFYSTSYDQNFDRSRAYFSVKAGLYTILKDFNASLNADADDSADILFREYCINLEYGESEWLNITFIPSSTDSYGFINGIEIVSMPPYLYYTSPDLKGVDFPQLVAGGSGTYLYEVQNNYALETKYRLNVGGQDIPPSRDTGMLRTWDADKKYVTTPSVESVEFAHKTKLIFTMTTPNYTAPEEVYRSVRNMGFTSNINMKFNLTWQFSVDSGFTYLVRLHFCSLNPEFKAAGDLRFYIFIEDMLATDVADVLWWTKQSGVPVVRDYVVLIQENQKKTNLSLKLHPNPTSVFRDVLLNAVEVFKINDSTGSLAGPNPDPRPKTSEVPFQISKNKSSGKTRTLAAVAGAVSGVILLSFIAAFFLIKRKNKDSNKKDGTSQGGGLSSLPTKLCRNFSIEEIKAATNNFDELLVVGVGGFGNVYKGYIDNGSTRVAIKRLKPGSQQGAREFMNEIEMLSQLRHLHLVSLIGYCYESNEMILVYEYMDRGTLRDHLYDTDKLSLSWRQRIQICIGAARGLHYLHTGTKHMIIHRDVKTTNILLDEKWVAKVSDFGLSRTGPTSSSKTHVSTQVKGSVGYLDPEYYKRQHLTEKSDVYSFGVVLLEVLSGRQPLLRTVEKQQMSLVDWAKHLYQKGSLGAIVDPKLKGEIAPECLHKFGEIAVSCLLEDGTQRPSMNDVVGMLEFVLKLQDSAVDGVTVSGGDYEEDSEDVFSTSHSSVHASDYSKSTGFNTSTDESYGSKDSARMIPELVFTEINDPKGR